MKLKLDDPGHAVIQDGKPVFVHDDGKEVAIDVPAMQLRIGQLNEEGKSEVDPVDLPHQGEGLRSLSLRFVVVRRMVQANQFALPVDAQRPVVALDQLPPVGHTQLKRSDFSRRKSASTFSRPISSYSRFSFSPVSAALSASPPGRKRRARPARRVSDAHLIVGLSEHGHGGIDYAFAGAGHHHARHHLVAAVGVVLLRPHVADVAVRQRDGRGVGEG